MRYRVIVECTATAYIGDVEVPDDVPEADRNKKAWELASAKVKTVMDRKVGERDVDDGIWISGLEAVERVVPGEPEYVPISLR